MHFHTEIIMPPTGDVEAAVKEVMEYFLEDEKDYASWWDWYVIGGRWSGTKLTAGIPQEKMESFYSQLKDRKITVSAVTAGKQTLSPSDQVATVDAMWRENFPTYGDICPLFDHYKGGDMDVCTIAEIPEGLNCSRLIVAESKGGKLRPRRMVVDEIWNGCEHQQTQFDGSVKKFLAGLPEEKEYRRVEIGADWICVTVDYHN